MRETDLLLKNLSAARASTGEHNFDVTAVSYLANEVEKHSENVCVFRFGVFCP